MEGNFFSRLPEGIKQNILGLHREKGERWLRSLPDLIAEISEKWSLTVENFFPNLSYNYVAPCICADETRAVLKIGVPENDSIVKSEANYLKLLDGNGTVKLLRIDEEYCALLLERLIPGESLKRICQIDDDRATRIAARLLRRIRREVPVAMKFPALESWAKGLQKAEPVKFAPNEVKKARKYFAELNGASKRHTLLHGDFHHRNILSAQRESFVSIDPKGIVGDIGYDISVFLNNPRGWLSTHPNRQVILKRRIEIFAEAFAIEPRDLRKWAYAEAVLSAWWTFEDGGKDAEKQLANAEIWET